MLGVPSTYLIANDDNASLYGGTGANFGISYNVTAGTTYYLYVRPYNASYSGTVSIVYQVAHPEMRIFIKTDSSTWI